MSQPIQEYQMTSGKSNLERETSGISFVFIFYAIIKIYTYMDIFYHNEVKVFIRKLQKPTQAKVLRSFELLEQYGRGLGMPHVKKLTTTLYELRIRGQQEVRVIFIIHKNAATLLHGFLKKTQQTPKREIETAQKRFKTLTSI